MSDPLSTKLKKLRNQYINSLPGKITEIALLVKQLHTKEWNKEKQETLINLVHRMVGSGKTFKVKGLTECAFVFEKLLREKVKTDRIITLPTRKKIYGYVEKLKKIAREAAGKECAMVKDEPTTSNKTTIGAQRMLSTTSNKTTIGAQRMLSTVQQTIKTDICGGKRVLLFLQDRRITSMEDRFRLYGYTLTHCHKAADLDDYSIGGKNAIIILDIQFLENDKGTLKKIKELSERYKDTQIVVLSDNDTLKKRLVAARGGADIFLIPPFDVPLLISKLNLMSQNRGSEPYHVLIVDDDVEFVAWCAYTLQQEGMITSVVSRPEQVIPQLIESRPELVLMDWHMPGYTGFDLASIIRQQDAFISIPIVFLTAECDPGKRTQAMKIGADDFLNKPVSSEQLVEAVRIRAERYRTLRFYMERDSLTGLYNHSKILEYLSTELSRARRYNAVLSFAMVDIDYFKKINDTYGHLNGDRVLKDLANLFKERLRKNDLIGRYGGEEFAVVFPNTEPGAVVKVLNEIRESFSRIKHRAEEKFFSVTFSAGITSSNYCKDTQSLVNASDMALYKAKSRGRNRVVMADAPLK